MSKLILLAFAVLAFGGCGRPGEAEGEVYDSTREWRVDSSQVSAEALRKAADNPRVGNFYQRVQWASVWDDDRASSLLEVLAQTDRHALEHVQFLPERPPDGAAEKEAALTKAALDYAGALAKGRVNPKRAWSVYTVPAPETDVAAALAAAVAFNEPLGPWFEALAPRTTNTAPFQPPISATESRQRAPRQA